MNEELERSAEIAVRDCLGVKPGEQVLIIVDERQRELGPPLYRAARRAGAEALLVEMPPRENHGEEPPPVIAAAMAAADVVFMPTSKSLSHTRARREAGERGARIASMPMITPDIMARTLSADYRAIDQRNASLHGLLSGGDEVRLTNPAGTELTFSIADRELHRDGGINHHPGDFANLPAGEVYCSPVEGTAEGVLVIDGSMAPLGLLDEPLQLIIRAGLVREILGASAGELEEVIDPYGEPARNIAELGIGTNEKAILTGNTLEDEKILGTCHIAIGDNSTFGGAVSVASHLDGVLLEPTLIVDGKTLLQAGEPRGW